MTSSGPGAPWTTLGRTVSTGEELDRIDALTERASPGPWTAFLEESQPIGGSSVIWVSDSDDIAPAADVDFVAHALDDIPRLVVALRAG